VSVVMTCLLSFASDALGRSSVIGGG